MASALYWALVIVLAGWPALAADEPAKAGDSIAANDAGKKKCSTIALSKVAPELYFALRRISWAIGLTPWFSSHEAIQP